MSALTAACGFKSQSQLAFQRDHILSQANTIGAYSESYLNKDVYTRVPPITYGPMGNIFEISILQLDQIYNLLK